MCPESALWPVGSAPCSTASGEQCCQGSCWLSPPWHLCPTAPVFCLHQSSGKWQCLKHCIEKSSTDLGVSKACTGRRAKRERNTKNGLCYHLEVAHKHDIFPYLAFLNKGEPDKWKTHHSKGFLSLKIKPLVPSAGFLIELHLYTKILTNCWGIEVFHRRTWVKKTYCILCRQI